MKVRNCAWQGEQFASKRIVWLRRDVQSRFCPKSVISAQSQLYLDLFCAWKQLGGGFQPDMAAKTADAIAVLELEWQKEKQIGQAKQTEPA